MRYWVITDTHFNHPALRQYCGRPEDSDSLIRDNILRNVTNDDVLIHLGDVCMGQDKEHNAFFGTIGCRTILVRGNHDGKSHHWYMLNGWDLCVDRFDIELFGKRIAFTHVPVGWDGYFDMNIHGHLHNANHRRNETELRKTLNGYHRLLALEHTDYQPVLLSKFVN